MKNHAVDAVQVDQFGDEVVTAADLYVQEARAHDLGEGADGFFHIHLTHVARPPSLGVGVDDEVRAQLGGYIPIMLKINCDDFSPGGFNVDDCSNVVKSMRARGLNLLELSGGGFAQRTELRNRARSKNIGLEEADFAGHAEKLMDVIRPTVFALVSGIRSMRTMEKLVKEKTVDMISMSRPFIRGDSENI